MSAHNTWDRLWSSHTISVRRAQHRVFNIPILSQKVGEEWEIGASKPVPQDVETTSSENLQRVSRWPFSHTPSILAANIVSQHNMQPRP
jgi:hypothetical protein